ncbi:hypothetical protein F4604DRAFT_1755636 [Suillus subluteus]|nr:hypothetical protein F4604DRAFT_1755636 [Suillus subluteus]
MSDLAKWQFGNLVMMRKLLVCLWLPHHYHAANLGRNFSISLNRSILRHYQLLVFFLNDERVIVDIPRPLSAITCVGSRRIGAVFHTKLRT